MQSCVCPVEGFLDFQSSCRAGSRLPAGERAGEPYIRRRSGIGTPVILPSRPLIGVRNPHSARARLSVPPLALLDRLEHVEHVPFQREAARLVAYQQCIVAKADLGQGEVEGVAGTAGTEVQGEFSRCMSSQSNGKGAHASASGMERIGRFADVMIHPFNAIERVPRERSSSRWWGVDIPSGGASKAVAGQKSKLKAP